MKKFLMLAVMLLLFGAAANAQPVNKETFVFAVKGADTLRLDKYGAACDGGVDRPCLMFMFGGGFVSGTRDAEPYLTYFEHFARRGYVVVSIDYRLGFRPLANGEVSMDGLKPRDFIGMFENTINMAVEDLYSATNFVLANAAGWGIDPSLIITSGSSAGAVSVLQGEYERANCSELVAVLPPDFRYAGVVSYAGAVFSNHGHLKWHSRPAPLMMFHGDADMNVPFGKKKIFKYGFFGSEYIAEKYEKQGFPYWFWMEKNADHSIAVTPMTDNLEEIECFIRKYVIDGRLMQTDEVVVIPGQPKVKKRFGIKDYVKANFAPQP